MTQYDLLATCWLTAGDASPLPEHDASPLPLRSRIEEAGNAGFTGFGLMHVDLAAFLQTSDLPTLRSMLDDNGFTSVELEFLTDWWKDKSERRESDKLLRMLADASEVLSPHHVKIGPDIHGGPYELDPWAQEFYRVSDAFAQVGTTVALEFMPFSNVRTLQHAIELVRAAGHPAGGLMLDLWHIERGGATLEELRALPLELVKGVEVDDAAAEQIDDGYSDTILRRRLCGEGAFRVPEFIAVLLDLGWDGPWGVEILSETYRLRPLEEALPEAFKTTMAQFELAEALRSPAGQR